MIAEDIVGDQIVLTAVGEPHVTERYLRWMSDPQVTQYLESRYSVPTLSDLGEYVRNMRESTDNYFFAIVERATGEHWGNVKLGPINRHHLNASVGIVIGEPSAWGRGVATETLSLLSRWAFAQLGLSKLTAGSYSANGGSVRAFEKAGWAVEGRQLSQVQLADGTRDDTVVLGLRREDLA